MIMSRSLNAQFIYQSFYHTSYHHIIQMAKLGICTGLSKSIPKISHHCCTFIIAKGPCLPHHPNVSTENLDPGPCFHLDFSFFKKFSFQNFTSALTIVNATTKHIFGYPARSKHPPIQIIKLLIQFSHHNG